MSIAQNLQATTMELRKARSEIAPGFQSVLGFAQASAKERGLKGGDATINDEDALRAIQKGIKMCRDTIAMAGNIINDSVQRTSKELSALESLLPQMASEDEVIESISVFLKANPEVAKSKGVMGAIMKHLMDTFGTSLDRGKASQLAKVASQVSDLVG